MTEPEIAKKNRTQVVIMIVALPLMVLFGAYSLIYLAQQEGLRETTNLGEFVDPPVRAHELGLTDAAGQPVEGSAHWWVWVVAGDCAGPCRQALAELAQLAEMLGRKAAETRLALIVNGQGALPVGEAQAVHHSFRSDGEETLADGVYLVDPAGNVVLRYGLTAGAATVAEDLKKLLNVRSDDGETQRKPTVPSENLQSDGPVG